MTALNPNKLFLTTRERLGKTNRINNYIRVNEHTVEPKLEQTGGTLQL